MQSSDPTLVPNPHAELISVREADLIRAITVLAPVRGQGLMVTRIVRENEPEVFSTLLMSGIRRNTFRPASETAVVRKRLAEIGFLVPESQAPNPVWFACDIDEPPLDLIPLRAAGTDPSRPVEDLVVNPTFRHLGNAGPWSLMQKRKHLASRFRTDCSWIWLEDAVLSLPCVYSAGREMEGCFDRLMPGQPPPTSLAVDARERLRNAGVLVSAAEMTHQREGRAHQLENARHQLGEARYTVLRPVGRPLQLAALRRYYRELIAEGFLPFGDKEWPNRFYTPHDSVAHFFHQQFTELMSQIAGERVRPTFLFFASYHPGSDLPPHRDREQCEYSMSVLIDHSPEPDDISPWPIYVRPPGAETGIPIGLGMGDALLYRGREVTHYRYPLGQGQYSSLWFFFYVGENFVGTLD